MNQITLLQPTDCHIHLRDGSALARTVADAEAQFTQVVVMPNLNPPVTNADLLQDYQARIQKYVSEPAFKPHLTLYLTEFTTPEQLAAAHAVGMVAVKLYPKGATTHSDAGVFNFAKCKACFAYLEQAQIPLLIHGEVVDPEVDIFDREQVFLNTKLYPLIEQFPNLKVVLEHITTAAAVDFILQAPAHVAATITAHHLWLNRNDMLVGGIRPHYYCLPVLKRKENQQALIQAAISGNPKFFLGTDSAPHTIEHKECAVGCAGVYTAYTGIELYAQVFAEYNALDKLECFASRFGPNFYGFDLPERTMTLIEKTWTIPNTLQVDAQLQPTQLAQANDIRPFLAGEQLQWQIKQQ